MGEQAPLNTIREITDLIKKNPMIFQAACELVETKLRTVGCSY